MKKLLLLFAAVMCMAAYASAQTTVYRGHLEITMGDPLNPGDETLYDVSLKDNGNGTCDLKLADFGLPALELKLGDINVENVKMTTAEAGSVINYSGSKAGLRLIPEGGTDADAIVADVKCEGYSKEGQLVMTITVEWIMDPTDPESVRMPIDVKFKGELVSGIADIEADAADAVYYNLQGARVAQPTTGLYIKVAGDKATKVRL